MIINPAQLLNANLFLCVTSPKGTVILHSTKQYKIAVKERAEKEAEMQRNQKILMEKASTTFVKGKQIKQQSLNNHLKHLIHRYAALTWSDGRKNTTELVTVQNL